MTCRTYSLKQVSVILGVSYSTVYNLVKNNTIPHIKIGGQYIVPIDVFDLWFKSSINGGDNP